MKPDRCTGAAPLRPNRSSSQQGILDRLLKTGTYFSKRRAAGQAGTGPFRQMFLKRDIAVRRMSTGLNIRTFVLSDAGGQGETAQYRN